MALSSPNFMSSTRSQGMRQTDAKTSLLVRKEKQHTHKMPEPPVHTDQPLAVPHHACPAHTISGAGAPSCPSQGSSRHLTSRLEASGSPLPVSFNTY